MRSIRWTLMCLGFVALFGLTSPLRAAVQDQAHFFSDSAVDQANQTINAIDGQYHKEVVIETFPAIPAEMQNSYDPAQKGEFFDRWAKQRFGEDKVNGIYILICKDPPFLKPEVGAKTGQRAFTLADSRQMASKMLAQFKQKQFDAGLSEGLSFIQSTLAANEQAAAPTGTGAGPVPSYPQSNSPSNYVPGASAPLPFPGGMRYPSAGGGMGIFGWFIAIAVVLIVIRVVGAVLRGFGGGGGSGMTGGGMTGGGMVGPGIGGGYGYGNGGAGGGGFGRGLLGGLIGGAAGSWLYDRERNEGGIFGGGNAGGTNFDAGNASGGPIDTGSGGGSFGSNSGFSGNDAGIPMSGDSGGGSFGDSGGGGGGGGGGDAGGGSF